MVALLLGVTACADSPTGEIARYDAANVSFEDIERSRGAVEAPTKGSPFERALVRYETVAGWLALARALPEPESATATDYRVRRAELLIEHFRALEGVAKPGLDQERLDKAVGELRQHFDADSKRYLFHLFKRVPPTGEGDARARLELAALAARIRGGESIANLAERHSESESRAYGGELGWVERGQVDPRMEQTIWRLPDGEPSEPVPVHGGWGLFLVTQRFEGSELGNEQLRTLAATRERLELEAETLAATLAEVEIASDDRVAVLAAPELAPTALGKRFRAYFPDSVITPPGAWQAFIEQHQERLQLAARIEASGWLGADGAAGWAGVVERGALAERVEAALRARIETRVTPETAAVEGHYEDNRARYRAGLRLRARLLRLPATPAVVEQMDGLADALDEGATLDELAGRFGVEVIDLGWLDAATMSAWEPKARRILVRTPVQGLTVPFTSGGFVSIAEVLERREPIPLGFEAVKEQVRRDYLEARRAELLATENEMALREIDFEFDAEALRRRLLMVEEAPLESRQ